MTREEAIRKLQKQKAEYLEEWVDFSGVAEAYDMAIEALSAEAAQPEHATCYLDSPCEYQNINIALPSPQPEYYDYSDIDDIWEYYADEQDINLTDGAKQLKDAMWVGYRKGKQDTQSEIIRCKDCRWGKEVCGNIECFVDTNVPPEYHGYEWFCPKGERRTDG